MNGCIYRTADDKCEFWSDHGKGIVSYCDFDDCEEKKPSNADRIRAMTDEELAGYLAPCACPPIWFNEDAGCPANKEPGESDCLQCWLDWLRREADE